MNKCELYKKINKKNGFLEGLKDPIKLELFNIFVQKLDELKIKYVLLPVSEGKYYIKIKEKDRNKITNLETRTIKAEIELIGENNVYEFVIKELQREEVI